MWFWHDIRYGLRGFRKDPGFAILAVLALALGVGSATVIFSVLHNVLLAPFPYADAKRLMTVEIRDPSAIGQAARSFFSTGEFLDIAAQNHVFDRTVGVVRTDVLYNRNGGAELFSGASVTSGTFELLGVAPQLGRALTAEDYQPGAPPVFVMSYKLWASSFDLDPGILNKSYTLNGISHTLIGIMPPRFTWFTGDVWLPITPNVGDPYGHISYYFLRGHLKPGITPSQAGAELNLLAQRLAEVYRDQYPKRFTVRVVPLAESVVGEFSKTLFTLMAAVSMLLLIACVNVANMLIARATARKKEIALRASLGASHWRLARQFFAESLLLAVAGAVTGCLFAYAGIKILVPLIPARTIPAEAVISLDPTVLLFALLISIGTAMLFGFAPAAYSYGEKLSESLKDSGKGVSGGFQHGRLRSMLVVAEVTLSLVLLVGAGLLMRSFIALQQSDLGFNPKNVLVARLPLPAQRYENAEQKRRFFTDLLRKLHDTPGILSAAETTSLPPIGGGGTEMDIPGKPHSEKWTAICQAVSVQFFETLGMRTLQGRLLSETDVEHDRKVAVVNQALVKKYFPAENPIGRTIFLNALKHIPSPVTDPSFEIVGVVSDARNQGIQEPTAPELFIPYTVTGFGTRGILVRTADDPARMFETVRRIVWSVDSNVAVTNTDSLEGHLRRLSYAAPRFGLMLVAGFAAVGLILVGIGVYSVLSYTVSRQTHEIGIRMALGAGAGSVLGMVLGMGMRLVGAGIILGLLVSAVAIRLISSQIWGVSKYDPLTIGAAILVLVLAGLAACYFPARRATQVDPVVALNA